MVLDLRSVLSAKLEYLVELVISRLNDEGQMYHLLSVCPRLKRLCLCIDSFKSIDQILIENLTDLEVTVLSLDHTFYTFIERHVTVKRAVVWVQYLEDRYKEVYQVYKNVEVLPLNHRSAWG
jgi:hypothetical protein